MADRSSAARKAAQTRKRRAAGKKVASARQGSLFFRTHSVALHSFRSTRLPTWSAAVRTENFRLRNSSQPTGSTVIATLLPCERLRSVPVEIGGPQLAFPVPDRRNYALPCYTPEYCGHQVFLRTVQ